MVAGTKCGGVRVAPFDAAAFDAERGGIFLEKADVPLPDRQLSALRTLTAEQLGIDEGFLRQVAAAFGLDTPAVIAPAVAQGTFHRLFVVNQPGAAARLLRISALAGSRWVGLMRLENSLAAILRARGLPVPNGEFADLVSPGGPRGVQLVDDGGGASAGALDRDEARMQVALGWIASFLARLHGIRGTGFGPLSLASTELAGATDAGGCVGVHRRWDSYMLLRLGEHLHACERSGAISAEEAADIATRFERCREQLQLQVSALLHGDPGSHNFLVDASGLCAVIDWEDALLGDPWFDVAALCTFHPERRHAAVFTGYGAMPTPGSDVWTRFWLYFLRIAIAKTVHRSRFAYADLPGREPASRRIQLAMAKLDQAALAR
jgi:hypothetical protein